METLHEKLRRFAMDNNSEDGVKHLDRVWANGDKIVSTLNAHRWRSLLMMCCYVHNHTVEGDTHSSHLRVAQWLRDGDFGHQHNFTAPEIAVAADAIEHYIKHVTDDHPSILSQMLHMAYVGPLDYNELLYRRYHTASEYEEMPHLEACEVAFNHVLTTYHPHDGTFKRTVYYSHVYHDELRIFDADLKATTYSRAVNLIEAMRDSAD